MKNFAFIVLGLVIAVGGRGVLAEEAATATSGPATQSGVRIELTSPTEWEVFQRKNAKEGSIHVEGKVLGVVAPVWVSIEATEPGKEVQGKPPAEPAGISTTSLWLSDSSMVRSSNITKDADGSVRFTFDLQSAGDDWQDVRIEVAKEKSVVARATVHHIGVGEVFVTGGQSNSTNWGEARTKTETETGMVTVFDGKEWTLAADPIPGVDAGQGKGSPWCLFGDDMYAKLHVPIGIVPVGKGATSVRQWLPKGDVVEIEPTRTYGMKKNSDGKWVSEGTLYDRMVERMKQLGPHGFRAMLWHQGESDAHQSAGHTLPGKDYRAMLERVIKESHKEVGWEVPWFVATATWGSPESPIDSDIRAAQHGVVEDGVAMQGPDTDTLIGENRQKNGTGVHMSEKGLHAHAQLWADVVGPWVEKAAK